MKAPHATPGPDRTRPPEPGSLRPFHLGTPLNLDRPGGMRLRVLQEGRVPLVSGCLVLDAGEAVVSPDRAGLSVLAGDALQGGTEARSGVALAEALERLGTHLRVSSGWDATTVAFTCTAERLPETLDLLAEVVRRPAFPADEVERIRNQQLAGIEKRRKRPSQIADDRADRTLHPEGHPFRRPLGGTEETVAALDREMIARWARDRYVPGRAGLVLVGDLEPADVELMVERTLGDWTGTTEPPPPLPRSEAPSPRPVVIAHRPGAVQSEIRIVHPAPPRRTPDLHPLQVANSILGGAFTSRLNLNLRETHGFTYGVRSSLALRRGGGQFEISTAVGTEVTVDAVREAMKELVLMVEEGPTELEVARSRDYLAGIFPLQVETTAQLAARLARLLIYDLPEDEYHRYRDEIRAVTREAAHEALVRHVDPARSPVVLCGDADEVGPGLEALGLGPVEVAG